MKYQLPEGAGVLFMKVGTHAQETLADIIARKKREIDEAGFSLWGYGGNTCHPTTMVQPFAKSHATAGTPIVLCMQPMESKHFAIPLRAKEFSVDGTQWQRIPDAINVLGSRYALCLKSLNQVEAELPLAATRVAVGNSMGKIGSDYIKGRVDKACLDIVSTDDAGPAVSIGLVAELTDPFAVFVRS
jgi:hypothetical protein